MNNQLQSIVLDWIPNHSKIIDFGCGDGTLLKILAEKKSVTSYGVEIDKEKINACIANGVSVIQQDIDAGIQNYKGMGFDVAIMASSIQCLRRPRNAMQNILQVANECVITLPNFGNWELRLGLLKGKMPSSAQLPAKWYETKNLHLCTIADFEELCTEELFEIKKKVYLNSRGSSSWLANTFPNLFAAEAVYLIG
ncbi:MAG: methionine biosynthesis protein MetW [SAR86 cluster bacterium]|jgi:methionine biosynthesis protein MetW|nr:methionine biosynthesis protein MetW [SAR86 cluster bacterium]MDA9140547.1 methionine biosynthesis protein MetW [Gammaproteobacteria bacterium]MBL6822927.1 methionine biosynthesis protein MetW [SAR86 cluster bacterium]MDA9936119.1 methionine biosynthesis protein MetW [Gammaproteobacteria bacterium]MDB2339605.1 methionine biosynthesis protein MetW [Gammaproteobacteria bacterium]